ncbi:MAG: hypothetical protein RLZZ283_768 [Candidatus Parcubacteria bacterium]|jgi:ferredoxin-NADP reductase
MERRRPTDRDPDLELVHEYRVITGPQPIAHNTFELRVQKPVGFTHLPGQAMKFYINGERSKTLSIVSAPHEPELVFAYRGGRPNSDRSFKPMLQGLSEGSVVHLRDPRGESVYPTEDGVPVVMLAGGIGITPFISMLRHAVHIDDPRSFHLLYSNTNAEDVAYGGELASLRLKRFLAKLFITHGDSANRFNEQDIQPLLALQPEPLFYIAGGVRFLKETTEMLVRLGVPESRIRSTEFSGYKDDDDLRAA